MAGLSLIPQERRFYDLFERASANLVESSLALRALIEDFTEVQQKVEHIRDLEHVGDSITHDLMNLLRRTFITPLDREDISEIANSLDDVVDLIDAAAVSMVLFRVESPKEKARELAALIVSCAEVVDRAIGKLRSRKEYQSMLQDSIELNSLENEADQVLRAALMELFDNHTDPVEIIKWREIYEQLETATDRCEDLADVLEGIVLKYG
jgi:predicted phosphate transport protein (TIGR00153 family)